MRIKKILCFFERAAGNGSHPRVSFKACHVPRGFPRPFKAIQTYSRVSGKKIVYFLRRMNLRKLQIPSANHQESSRLQPPLFGVWSLEILWSLEVGVWMFARPPLPGHVSLCQSPLDSGCSEMACGKTPNHIKHLIIACLKRFSGQIIISHVGTFIALSTLIVDANDVIWPKAWILKI